MDERWLKIGEDSWELHGKDQYPGTQLIIYAEGSQYSYILGMTTHKIQKGEKERIKWSELLPIVKLVAPLENGKVKYWNSLASAKAHAEENRFNPALLERAGIVLEKEILN